MYIESLHLRNIAQHEVLDWELGPGLIGILAGNGAGKSNALAAAYAMITGDYSRHPLGKDGMIRQQAGEKDKSEIRGTLCQGNDRLEIVRGLQRPVKNELVYTINGVKQKPLTKVSEIADVIMRSTRLTRRLLDDFVFVSQGALFGFLSSVPSERIKSFAHMCGTSLAEDCWEALGRRISIDQMFVRQDFSNLDSLRQQAGQMEQTVSDLDSRIRAAQGKMLQPDYAQRLRDELQRHAAAITAASDMGRVNEEGAQAHKLWQQWQQEVVRCRSRCEQLPDENAVRQEHAGLQQVQSQVRRHQELLSRQDDARRNLAAAEAVRERTSHEHAAATVGVNNFAVPADHEQQVQQLMEQIAERKPLAETRVLDGVPVCPTCGTPMASLRDRVTQAQAEIKERAQQLLALRSVVQQRQQLDAALQTALRNHERAEVAEAVARQSVSQIQETLATMPVQVMDVLPRIGQLQTVIDQIANASHELQRATTAEAQAATRLELLQKQAKQLQERMQLRLADEGAAARQQLADHDAAEATMRELQRAGAGLAENLRQTRSMITELEQQQKVQQNLHRWLETLTHVRDYVMHRDKLPRLVHERSLDAMLASMNGYLQQFGGVYSVEVSSGDLSFIANFPNGTRIPAIGLSGGQKVMLALAFRLTMNSLFADSLGIMVLDEPTDGLDHDNRRLAAEVFRKLGNMLAATGQQVLVVTHDEILESAFQRCVRIGSGSAERIEDAA